MFTGAGTSDYVGDTCAPYLRHAGDTTLYDFKPIATTDIVSAPRDFLNPDEPRSSCPSLAPAIAPSLWPAVQVAKTFVKNVKFINITCAPEGRLAVESEAMPTSSRCSSPVPTTRASP